MALGSNVKHVYEHIIRIRQRFLAGVSGRLLDHGFGNGLLSRYFEEEGFEVYGVESEGSAFRDDFPSVSEQSSKFKFVPASSHAIPFPSSFFNAVVSNQVLNFLSSEQQIEGIINELVRILNPDGKLVITVMAENNYLFEDYAVPPAVSRGLIRVRVNGRIVRDRMYYRFGSSRDIQSILEKSGMLIDDVGYYDFKLLDVRCAKHYIYLAHKK